MFYDNEMEQTVHDVWDQGMTLNSNSIIHGDSVGGRIFVNEAGLTVSLIPAGDDHGWEEKFNEGSVVVVSSSESGLAAGLNQITAASN